MNRFVLYVLLLAAVGVTAVAGLVHGRLSGRWGRPTQFVALAQRLEQFPTDVGHWKLRNSFDMVQSVRDELECAGYMNRRYVNQETGEAVGVAVILGPSGPISVHTPEVCYSSRHYRIIQPPQPLQIRDAASGEASYWATTFESTRIEKSLLRVYWAWSTDGGWTAAEHPRFEYAGQPFLFKLQLAAELPAGTDLTQQDPCGNFLRDFVPVFKQHVFGQASPRQGVAP